MIYCSGSLQQLAAQTNLILNGGFEHINSCSEYNAPCGLQKGKQYIFRGLFSAQLNPKLLLRPGIALGKKFFVPEKTFSGNIQPDSIINIKALPSLDLYEFVYQFTSDGTEQYLTFGTYIKEDFAFNKKKLFSKQDISLRLDNFSLTPVDSMEGLCDAFEHNQKIIYGYNFRHKEMDYSLYAKGQLAVALVTSDSTYITRKKILPPAIVADTLRLGDVFFDFDKSRLKPEADRMLYRFFNNEKKLISFDSIYIEGHTDSIGGDVHNLMLSERRCEEIQSWLMKNKLADVKNVQIHPFGKTKPIASNSTAQGRALNRRVEIIVFRKYKK